MAVKTLAPSEAQIEEEMDRLTRNGLPGLGYNDDALERVAALTCRINALKREKGAAIPAHVYQRPEVLLGVADFVGDSYKLSKMCAKASERSIVFCGVRFMAETAKILNPGKEVFLPAVEAGCSLSESITSAQVRSLKAKYPGAPVVTYINTDAEVKAESSVIVTSANAPAIVKKLYAKHPRIIFIPDEMMGRNLAKTLGKRVGSEMIIWKGSCIVHDNFDAASVAVYRKMFPGVDIMAHSECSPSLVSAVDFVGGTGDMMKRVASTRAPAYMLVTECGLGDLARTRFPNKRFVPMCRLCPYMKATDLQSILRCLERPSPAHRIEVPPATARKARRALERMFELSEDTAKL